MRHSILCLSVLVFVGSAACAEDPPGGAAGQRCLPGNICDPGLFCDNGTCVDPEGFCGDGTCDQDENAASCPADCEDSCGNGTCDGDETAVTCPADCDDAWCGNGTCDAGESATSCPEDCAGSVTCADGVENGSETDTDCGGGDCPPCPNGDSCEEAADCQSGHCDVVTCAPCGGHADCAALAGTYCDGGSCVPQLADGEACASDEECVNGHCPAQDSVCCDAACASTCESCLGAKTGGADGECGPVTSGTDPDGECGTDLLCEGGLCVCSLPDANEPNDTELTAVALGTLSDADPNPLPQVSGVIGSGDEDWFQFDGTDNFPSTVDPYFAVVTGSGVRICAYFVCESGSTEVNCPSGTVADTSGAAHPGCCAQTVTSFTVDLNCTGTTDDSASVTFRLDSLTSECLPYTVAYHY